MCRVNDVGKGANYAIYRSVGDNKLSFYPNPEIATSHDPTWESFKYIDCNGYTLDPDMTPKIMTPNM